jgi:hypothetical protein
VNVRLIERARLTAAQRGAMHAVFSGQFPDVSRETFERDLATKNWVVLLEHAGGAVGGFTTLHLHDARFAGRDLQVVFSGDTVVAPEAAGHAALWEFWLGALGHLRADDAVPLYWLLIVSGYRTYRFLPIFLRAFHPRCDVPTPPDTQALMDHLATRRFGPRYDPASGIVRFAQPQRLREDLRRIPANRMDDPHVAFFARRDPGHEQGDELVCLAEIAHGNLTAAGRRMWERGQRRFAAAGAPR